MLRRTNTLNRLHSIAIRLNCKYAARVYCIPVHNDGTRTALAQIAALLRPRQASFLPQDMEQRLFCLNGEAAPLPIEHQFYLVFCHLCSPVFVIGAHLHGLSLGADVTSSDYSGYNILPPASFDGMTDLLWGLHKETMTDFWQNSEAHRGLVIQEAQNAEPQPTIKVLGGNLGIRMSALTTLPPFFSPYYFYNRTPLLARGEDTLMGMAASQSHIRCLDIQTPIFHDTYGDYPKVPDLRNDSRVRDRLYYACIGWIGRNVFFRWKTGHTPSEFTQRNRQLAAGAKALARYTNDRRFLYLPDIQSAAESWLPDMIGQYQKSKEAWNELTERWFGR